MGNGNGRPRRSPTYPSSGTPSVPDITPVSVITGWASFQYRNSIAPSQHSVTRQKLDVRSRYKPLPENPIKGICTLVQWYLVYRLSCDTTFQSCAGISVDRENRRMPLLEKLQSLGRSFLRMTLKFPYLHPLKAYVEHNAMNALPTEILEMVAGNIEDVEFFNIRLVNRHLQGSYCLISPDGTFIFDVICSVGIV